jgi:nuclear transport factor 2 (NTF2) superfamily protein
MSLFMHRCLEPSSAANSAAARAQSAGRARIARDPALGDLACAPNSCRRNRSNLRHARAAIEAFPERNDRHKPDYRVVHEAWSSLPGRIAARLVYEWRDERGQRLRGYGDGSFETDRPGLMRLRNGRNNDAPIVESDLSRYWYSVQRPAAHSSHCDSGT